MRFSEIVKQAVTMLEDSGRVSYRALKREFDLDQETLDDLKNELIEVLEVAVDKNGEMLVWGSGEASNTHDAPHPAKKRIATPTIGTTSSDVERRQITVMFCDLVGSTAMSKKLDPEDLREVMQAYQKTAGSVIERYAGHVAQYLGDGLMVYFGWPMAHEDDAVRAVRASLEIVGAIKKMIAPVPLQVRIGIATGPVVVGETGAGDAAVPKLAVGETPNVAARLQGLAAPDEIVIGPTTETLTRGTFDYDDVGERELKGIIDPLRAWRVVGVSVAEDRFEARAIGGLTPLVGRKIEIDLLLERWAEAKDGDGQVVLLSGEPGIGKSRLTQVLRERLANEPHVPLRYQCSPYHTNTAFYPIIDQLQRAAGFVKGETPESRLDKLEALLAQGTENIDEATPLLSSLLSLPVDRYPPINLSPQRRKEKTYKVLAEQAAGLALHKPVLMIFEDVHWVDPTTLDTLGAIIDRIQRAPVLLLITHRPEFEPPWDAYGHITALSLNRFSRRHGAQMVAELSGGQTLPDAVLDEIIDKTDGVPLFVEELTKTVLEANVAKSGEHNGGVDSTTVIPATLQDSLMARLDRLKSGKEIAQLGACIGRDFDHRLIAAIAAENHPDFEGALDRLIEAGLLYRHGQRPEAKYSFKHALVQETAYQSLLKSRRRAIHSSIAHALQDRFGDIVDSEPEVIAHHYTEAGRNEQAILYWQRAGERAAQRSANVEAISHFTKALELLRAVPESSPRDQQELALLMALGTAQMVTKGFAATEAGLALDRADELCRRLGDRSEVADVLLGLWAFHVSGQSTLATAREIAEQLLRRAQDAGDSTALLKAHIVMPINLFYQGEFTDVREHLDRSLDLYDRDEHHADFVATSGYDRGIIIHCWSAMTYWITGYPGQALASSSEALNQSRALGHPYTSAVALAYAAWVHGWRGEFQVASDYAETATTISDEHGFTLTWAWGTIFYNLARAGLRTGRTNVTSADGAVAKLRGAGFGLWMPHLLAGMAEINYAASQPENALGNLREALELSQRRGDRFYEAELHRLNGEIILHANGRTPSAATASEAEGCFENALEIARQQSAKSFELRAAVSLAQLWTQQGKTTQARELLTPLYSWFTEGFDTKDLQEAKSLLDEIA